MEANKLTIKIGDYYMDRLNCIVQITSYFNGSVRYKNVHGPFGLNTSNQLYMDCEDFIKFVRIQSTKLEPLIILYGSKTKA